MEEIVKVFVPGRPVPQGSLAVGAHGNMYWSNTKTLRPWRKAMTDAVKAFMPRDLGDGYDDGVRVELKFYHERPKSVTRTHKITAGDLDKLTRAALDSLTDSKIITDDSRVVELDCGKYYVNDEHPTEGVYITVWTL